MSSPKCSAATSRPPVGPRGEAVTLEKGEAEREMRATTSAPTAAGVDALGVGNRAVTSGHRKRGLADDKQRVAHCPIRTKPKSTVRSVLPSPQRAISTIGLNRALTVRRQLGQQRQQALHHDSPVRHARAPASPAREALELHLRLLHLQANPKVYFYLRFCDDTYLRISA